ncbi:MAG: type II CRISPR-associated endonuclease Cas1 [Oscillospiraceae bacterium]|nr:type II CRISPR-associated endonuclease Cas1 [Oscillospiraceae bacterium]
MSWRTVAITGRAKLDYRMGYMLIRKDTEQRVFLDDVNVLILESTAISLTTYLLKELASKKVKTIFCDELHNPYGELSPFYNNTSCTANIAEQIAWEKVRKDAVWRNIIKEKIKNQAEVLRSIGECEKAEMLQAYAEDVRDGDISNREGHAAKVYFNALFGNSFSRGQDNQINAALNYGYALILSVFNREIVAFGYLTQLGINHHNTYNYFNLSCDLMEPVRPFVDLLVKTSDFKEFGMTEKHIMLGLLSQEVNVNGQKNYLTNAISVYTKSVLNAINSEDEIKYVHFL